MIDLHLEFWRAREKYNLIQVDVTRSLSVNDEDVEDLARILTNFMRSKGYRKVREERGQ